jgi:hypothetical protein
MRGKLRDKRTETKRDAMKREFVERRRTNRRENRNMAWQNIQVDQEEDYLLEEEEMLFENPNPKK